MAGQEANSYVGPLLCRRTVKTHYEFASSEYSLGITSRVQHCPHSCLCSLGTAMGGSTLDVIGNNFTCFLQPALFIFIPSFFPLVCTCPGKAFQV